MRQWGVAVEAPASPEAVCSQTLVPPGFPSPSFLAVRFGAALDLTAPWFPSLPIGVIVESTM